MQISRLLLLCLLVFILASCSKTAGANTESSTLDQLQKENTSLKQEVDKLEKDNTQLSSKFNSFVEDYEKQRNAAYNHELYQFNTTSQVIFQAMRNGDVTALRENVNENIQVSSKEFTITKDGSKFKFPFKNFQLNAFDKQNIIVLKNFSYEDNYNDFIMVYAVRSTKDNPDGDYYLYLTYSKDANSEWKLTDIASNP